MKMNKKKALVICLILTISSVSLVINIQAEDRENIKLDDNKPFYPIDSRDVTYKFIKVANDHQHIGDYELGTLNRGFINKNRDVVFTETNSHYTPYGIWFWDYDSQELTPIALRDDTTPGIPNGEFSYFSNCAALNENGDIAFRANVNIDGGDNCETVWLYDEDGLHPIAKTGDIIDDHTIVDLLKPEALQVIMLNKNKQMVFTVLLEDNKYGICSYDDQNGLELIVAEDEVIFDVYEVTYLYHIDLNQNGDVVICLDAGLDDDEIDMICKYDLENQEFELVEIDPADLDYYYDFFQPIINSLGDVTYIGYYKHFRSDVTGVNEVKLDGYSILKPPEKIPYEPLPLAPGLPDDYALNDNGRHIGGCFFSFHNPTTNDELMVACRVRFQNDNGDGCSYYYNDGLYKYYQGDIQPIAYEYQSAPGLNGIGIIGGSLIDDYPCFTNPTVNEKGFVAYFSDLGHLNDQGDLQRDGEGVFIYDSNNVTHKVIDNIVSYIDGDEVCWIEFGFMGEQSTDDAYEFTKYRERLGIDNGLGDMTNDGTLIIKLNLDPTNNPNDDRDCFYIAIPIYADIDGDGDVDQSDLGILLAGYELPPESPHYDERADLDFDGDIDQSDLGILLAYYGYPDI